jgi:mono/diheme cytochrome c family protein
LSAVASVALLAFASAAQQQPPNTPNPGSMPAMQGRSGMQGPAQKPGQTIIQRGNNEIEIRVVGTPTAQKPNAPTGIDFHAEVMAFLQSRCATCHNASRRDGGYSVSTIEGIFKGGKKFGAKTIVPGKPQESALIGYLRGTIQPRMPMDGKTVPEAQIARIETWIKEGAKTEFYSSEWLKRPPVRPPVPRVREVGWTNNAIDNFLMAKWEASGLKPTPPADKITLMRRIFADLVGVPPTLKQQQMFLNDTAPNAYEKLVDTLLEDPLYGERWGRHWLDLVRYADSDGQEQDKTRPRAWRYRDYVIRSLNEDKPYDRFLKEQLAGDELYPGDLNAWIATGYLRMAPGEDFDEGDNHRRQEFLNDITDTTGSVMLGMTVGCARCHDHKYDPISQADYYRLQAFFAATRLTRATLPENKEPMRYRGKFAEAERKLEPLRLAMNNLFAKHRPLALEEKLAKAKPGEKVEVKEDDINRSIDKVEADRATRDKLREEMEPLQEQSSMYSPLAEVITDRTAEIPRTYILKAGNLWEPVREVQPGFPAMFFGGKATPARISPPPDSRTTGRRAALANWIASKENPMTARVIMNRLWYHHFGRGLIGTLSDFGGLGERPTHPELLDWLASEFVRNNWSLKKMHRLMVTSSAYRMAIASDPKNEEIDPANRLFWRRNRMRLEGEAIRDSILAVSGRLNETTGGPGFYPKMSEEELEGSKRDRWGQSASDEVRRRSVYIFRRRSTPFQFLEIFDAPDASQTCARRIVSNTVPQALALFNGEFARTEARALARRIVKEAPGNWTQQIELAYRLVFCRPPTAAQTVRAKRFLQTQGERYLKENALQDAQAREEAGMEALVDFCHVLFNASEFLYID